MKLTKEIRKILLYLFFGICTTIINLVVYQVCYKLLEVSNVLSAITAWFLAVIFAFLSNKIWVFESNTFTGVMFWKECASFFTCRLFTGLLDVLIMYIMVDIFTYDAFVWKAISNILVVIINYIAGKVIVFKKSKK